MLHSGHSSIYNRGVDRKIRLCFLLVFLFVFYSCVFHLYDFVQSWSLATFVFGLEQIGAKFNISELDRQLLNSSTVKQDDPKLVEIVRRLLLPPPSTSTPYNFSNPKLSIKGANPSAGQVQSVAHILKTFGSDGFFVECGANDGEWNSNSIWLENTLGWSGLLLEPDPRPWAKLRNKNRKAHLAHLCLSNTAHPKLASFYINERESHSLFSGLRKSHVYGPAIYPINVQCVPLFTLLLALNRTTVDFFSLDVEGSEIDVLRTIPFHKILFKVITIEHVVLKEGKEFLKKFMTRRGFRFYRTVVDPNFSSGDSIFIHKSIFSKKESASGIEIKGGEDSNLTREPR